eukprot:4417933-Heterocapsa_arctica.AAC.1
MIWWTPDAGLQLSATLEAGRQAIPIGLRGSLACCAGWGRRKERRMPIKRQRSTEEQQRFMQLMYMINACHALGCCARSRLGYSPGVRSHFVNQVGMSVHKQTVARLRHPTKPCARVLQTDMRT